MFCLKRTSGDDQIAYSMYRHSNLQTTHFYCSLWKRSGSSSSNNRAKERNKFSLFRHFSHPNHPTHSLGTQKCARLSCIRHVPIFGK